MKNNSKYFKTASLIMGLLYASSTLLYADTVIGKIGAINTLKNGQIEITLQNGKETQKVILSTATIVESRIAAKKIKPGTKIYLSGRGSSSGGRKGLKSPFSGIPKNMRKSMGLPDMPETPDIPGQPSVGPEIPKIPKIPKVPKAKAKTSEGANPEEKNAAADQGQAKKQRTEPPPAQEPSAEEKSLFGKADAGKSILKSSGSPEEAMPEPGRKVLKVKTTDKGVSLELEGLGGKSEQVTLQPDKTVVQALSLAELRKDMNIRAEMVRDSLSKVNMAEKITVIE